MEKMTRKKVEIIELSVVRENGSNDNLISLIIYRTDNVYVKADKFLLWKKNPNSMELVGTYGNAQEITDQIIKMNTKIIVDYDPEAYVINNFDENDFEKMKRTLDLLLPLYATD